MLVPTFHDLLVDLPGVLLVGKLDLLIVGEVEGDKFQRGGWVVAQKGTYLLETRRQIVAAERPGKIPLRQNKGRLQG